MMRVKGRKWLIIGDPIAGYCAFYWGMRDQIWHRTKTKAKAFIRGRP